MSDYIIKLENGNYMKYDQTNDYELTVDDTSYIKVAETFSSLKEAEEFAICINKRRDGKFVILSYEDAVSIVEIDESGTLLKEKDLNISTQDNRECSMKSDKEKLIKINERWDDGELSWDELKQDYLWLKDKCNELLELR